MSQREDEVYEDPQLKKMKEAKTGIEMIASWGQPIDTIHSIYAERMPDQIRDYAHTPTMHAIERQMQKKLDPKIWPLIMIAIYLTNKHYEAVGHWAILARQRGATDDEILEAAAAVNYGNSKSKEVETDEVMTAVFDDPEFKNTKSII
jgi:alkylhydroperoxidase/carboxymuconolactone decarboxylase family protein YurZ